MSLYDDPLQKQLRADKNLLTRIDTYGKGLTPGQVKLVESFMKWVDGGKALTPSQRAVAEDIDEQTVR